MPKYSIEQIKDLYINDNLSIKEIARKFKTCSKTISKNLKDSGVDILLSKEGKILSDKRFGSLVVLERSKNKKTNQCFNWVCRCDCGTILEVSTSSLLSKTRKRTACKKCSRFNDAQNKDGGYKELSGRYFNSLKRTRTKNLEFSITINYIYDLYISQNKKCAITGWDIVLSNVGPKRIVQTASLDRIDSDKGYIEGNVQWVHKDINCIKQDYSMEYFLQMCKAATEHANKS